MKKIIYILLIIFILSFFIYQNDEILIPEDSIRFRIIANSNNSEDQVLKKTIKKDLEKEFFPLLENTTSKEEAEKIILENENLINETLKKYNVNYNINYGNNYFPQKEYKGVTYNEGDYNSLVISLGEAKGNNWWCVMYPPLCLLDAKSEEEDMEEVEYTSFIKQVLDKLTS